MRIGILTFHCANNYGAVLQCYALQETLRSMGYNVEVIDYRPKFLNNSTLINWKRFTNGNFSQRIKGIISEITLFPRRFYRSKIFSNFIEKNISLSKHNSTFDYIDSNYDIYIFGSDQIWNQRITKNLTNPYCGYLGFPKCNKKFISYAASMEGDNIKSYKEQYSNLLKNFDFISVREAKMIKLLSPLTEKKIEIVLDPTLILNKELWNNIIKKPRLKQRYVLVYQVRVDDNTVKVAEEIAKQIGAIVVNIQTWVDNKYKKHTYKCVSPQQFLGWFKEAECIVTTSFHGTAFSIIFEKPFYTIKLPDNKNERSQNLLSSINLNERLIEYKYVPEFSNIDYSSISNKLLQLKKDSLRFLTDSLNCNL